MDNKKKIIIGVLILIVSLGIGYILFGKTLFNKNEVDNSKTNTSTAKYTFTSGDNAAAQGNPAILEVYELTSNELKFGYNKALNYNTNVTDRQVKGVAKKVSDNIYAYEELVSSHNYKLEFTIGNDSVKLSEYEDGNLIGTINLYR